MRIYPSSGREFEKNSMLFAGKVTLRQNTKRVFIGVDRRKIVSKTVFSLCSMFVVFAISTTDLHAQNLETARNVFYQPVLDHFPNLISTDPRGEFEYFRGPEISDDPQGVYQNLLWLAENAENPEVRSFLNEPVLAARVSYFLAWFVNRAIHEDSNAIAGFFRKVESPHHLVKTFEALEKAIGKDTLRTGFEWNSGQFAAEQRVPLDGPEAHLFARIRLRDKSVVPDAPDSAALGTPDIEYDRFYDLQTRIVGKEYVRTLVHLHQEGLLDLEKVFRDRIRSFAFYEMSTTSGFYDGSSYETADTFKKAYVSDWIFAIIDTIGEERTAQILVDNLKVDPIYTNPAHPDYSAAHTRGVSPVREGIVRWTLIFGTPLLKQKILDFVISSAAQQAIDWSRPLEDQRTPDIYPINRERITSLGRLIKTGITEMLADKIARGEVANQNVWLALKNTLSDQNDDYRNTSVRLLTSWYAFFVKERDALRTTFQARVTELQQQEATLTSSDDSQQKMPIGTLEEAWDKLLSITSALLTRMRGKPVTRAEITAEITRLSTEYDRETETLLRAEGVANNIGGAQEFLKLFFYPDEWHLVSVKHAVEYNDRVRARADQLRCVYLFAN